MREEDFCGEAVLEKGPSQKMGGAIAVHGDPLCNMHRPYSVLFVALCLFAGVVIALDAPSDEFSAPTSGSILVPARTSIDALSSPFHAKECQEALAEHRSSAKPVHLEHHEASQGVLEKRDSMSPPHPTSSASCTPCCGAESVAVEFSRPNSNPKYVHIAI